MSKYIFEIHLLKNSPEEEAIHKLALEPEKQEDESFFLHYMSKDTVQVDRICLKPIECAGYILRKVSFRQGAEQLLLNCQNSTMLTPEVLLLGKDSAVYADSLRTDEPIIVEGELVSFGDQHLDILQRTYADQLQEKERIRSEIERISIEYEVLREENRAYQNLVNQKDIYCLELEQILKQYEKTFAIRVRVFFSELMKKGKSQIKQTIKNMHIKQILKRIYKSVMRK